MKSILIALTVMIAGLSTGCAEMEQLAKQYNPDNGNVAGLKNGDCSRTDHMGVCVEYYHTPEATARLSARKEIEAAVVAIEVAKNEKEAEKKALVMAFLGSNLNHRCNVNGDKRFSLSVYCGNGGGKLLQWAGPLTKAQVEQGLKELEAELLATEKQERIVMEKEDIAAEKEHQKEQAAYMRILKQQEAAYAAKQKGEAAALQAAIIERRDHPEIGAARDRTANKARYERMKAEEDVYRAKHNGRSAEEDQMKVLEGASKQYIDQQRLQNALKGY